MDSRKKIAGLLILLLLLMLLCVGYHVPRIAVERAGPRSSPVVTENTKSGEKSIATVTKSLAKTSPLTTAESSPPRSPIVFRIQKKRKGFTLSGGYYDEVQMQSFAALFEGAGTVGFGPHDYNKTRKPDEALVLARELAPIFSNDFLEGEMGYDGKMFYIAGKVADPRTKDLVHKILSTHSVDFREKIEVAKPNYPQLDLTKTKNGRLEFSGILAAQKEYDLLAKVLRKAGLPVRQEVRIDPDRIPAEWLNTVQKILPAFVKNFVSGKISAKERSLVVEGLVSNDATYQNVQKILKDSKLPYRLQLRISPPEAVSTPRKKMTPETKHQEGDSEKKMVENHIRNVLRLENIEFETGSARLRPESRDVLDRIAAILELYDNVEIEIAGYTDNVGSAEKNLLLSQKRVESVKKALVSRGIDPKRIRTVGYGETHPIVPNTDEKNRQLNRRVEFHVIKIDKGD